MEPWAFESGAAGTPTPYPATFVAGFPAAATSTLPATIPGPYWFHMMAEEFRNFIINTGQAPDPYNVGQLLQGINNIIAERG
jgi:hypothetical protein